MHQSSRHKESARRVFKPIGFNERVRLNNHARLREITDRMTAVMQSYWVEEWKIEKNP